MDYQGGRDFGTRKQRVAEECDRINQQFLSDPNYETTIEQLEQFKGKFDAMDEDGSGDIDIFELQRAMEKLGKPKNQLELRKMIQEVDLDNSNTINYHEFIIMMLGKKNSILRLILMFEAMAHPVDTRPTGPPPKRSLQDLP